MSKEKEEEMENSAQQRVDKIKSWLKRPENLLIVIILIGAFVLRWQYFDLAKDQTLWWDEAEYMATAKHWAFGVPYNINEQRPPLFQLFGAFLLMLGFNEFILKFFLVLVPSTVLIYLTYLLGKELFDAKIGLFAASASAVMWSYLFWSARFQPDFFSLCFQLLSIIFFWKLVKEPHKKYANLAGIFAALGFYFKVSALLVPASFFIFVLFKDQFGFIRNKYYWRTFFAFVLTMMPFMAWQYSTFGNPLAFAPSYGVEGGTTERALGLMALDFILKPGASFLEDNFYVFAILFIIGILFAFGRIVLTFDLLIKDEKNRIEPNIFSLIFIIAVLAFYIFYIQGVIEDRWVFLMAPFAFVFAGKGFFSLVEMLKLKSKTAIWLILIVFFVMLYHNQVGHAEALIKNKLPSYDQVREAGLWIKENSNKDESVVSASYTQITSYSERLVYPYAPYQNEISFTEFLRQKKPRYMMLSFFESHPAWAYQGKFHPNGVFAVISMPYLNSTIFVNEQGQTTEIDIKQNVQREDMNFNLVYPKNQITGVFIYEISYL